MRTKLHARNTARFTLLLAILSIIFFSRGCDATATVTVQFVSFEATSPTTCTSGALANCDVVITYCAEVPNAGVSLNCQTSATFTFIDGQTITGTVGVDQATASLDISTTQTFTIQFDVNEMGSGNTGSSATSTMIVPAPGTHFFTQSLTVAAGTNPTTDPERQYQGLWRVMVVCDAGFSGPTCSDTTVTVAPTLTPPTTIAPGVTVVPVTIAPGGDSRGDSSGHGAGDSENGGIDDSDTGTDSDNNGHGAGDSENGGIDGSDTGTDSDNNLNSDSGTARSDGNTDSSNYSDSSSWD